MLDNKRHTQFGVVQPPRESNYGAKVELSRLSNDPMFTLGLDIVNGQTNFYEKHKSYR